MRSRSKSLQRRLERLRKYLEQPEWNPDELRWAATARRIPPTPFTGRSGNVVNTDTSRRTSHTRA